MRRVVLRVYVTMELVSPPTEWYSGHLADMMSTYDVSSDDLSPESSSSSSSCPCADGTCLFVVSADDVVGDPWCRAGDSLPGWSATATWRHDGSEAGPAIWRHDGSEAGPVAWRHDGSEAAPVAWRHDGSQAGLHSPWPAVTDTPLAEVLLRQSARVEQPTVNDDSWIDMFDPRHFVTRSQRTTATDVHQTDVSTRSSLHGPSGDVCVTLMGRQDGFLSCLSPCGEEAAQSLDPFAHQSAYSVHQTVEVPPRAPSPPRPPSPPRLQAGAVGGSKPQCSYMTMIAMAILSAPQRRILLADIYAYINARYPYFRSAKSAWRNSVRHNLSVNECFVKDGRAPSGRGFYWAIHAACVDDFVGGQFNRRRARQRAQYMYKALQENRQRAHVLLDAGQCAAGARMTSHVAYLQYST